MIQTDFVVKVVKVFSADKHPNADKLDVLTVGVDAPFPGVQVINQRGEFTPGDECVYVSAGAIVQVEDPRWTFLKSRAGTKTEYRIRPMSLRGVKSWGVVTPLSDLRLPLGSDVADILNIKKWQDDTTDEVDTSPKPEVRRGWFSRKINHWFKGETRHLDAPVYGVANLRFNNPFAPNEAVVVTEKLHGANVRWVRFGKKLIVGSHRAWKTDTRSWLQRVLRTKGFHTSHYYGEDIWTEAVLSAGDINQWEGGVVYYGEVYGVTKSGKHIQKGFSYGLDTLKLAVFPSSFNLKKDCWQFNWNTSIIAVGRPDEYTIDYKTVAEEDSYYGGMSEGVVLHSLERPGVAAKWVSVRYKERNDE